jgi:uncharacterized protein (TIGR04255 family)
MTTFLPERHYPRAPITEAVIDLSVTFDSEPSVETLEAIGDDSYPSRTKVVSNSFQVNGNIGAAISSEQIGWRFRSTDGRYIYQARKTGFGLSRLAPYERWDAFGGEARRLWEKYRVATKPNGLKRIAVRYINRIELPLPFGDFGEYFLTAPLVSPHLPQGLSNYLMNLTIPVDEFVVATITQAILPKEPTPTPSSSANPETLSMLLDVDVSQSSGLLVAGDAVWERFEYLRQVKNHVFESCITDKARELFQ